MLSWSAACSVLAGLVETPKGEEDFTAETAEDAESRAAAGLRKTRLFSDILCDLCVLP